MAETVPKGNVKIVRNIAYEIIATEKGYAYLICLTTALITICLYSHINSMGVLYNDFIIDHGGGVGGLSTVTGVYQRMMSVSGILTNVALKKFTLRQVGLFGAFLYTLGWFFTIFIDSMMELVVTLGVMQGMGQGMVLSICLTVFNHYFVKKNMMMFSCCQLIVSIATMLFPLFLEYTLNEYGFKGSILIITGIASHSILCVISLHPVEWHSKWKALYSIIPTDESATTDKYQNNSDEYKIKVIEKEFTVKRVVDDVKLPNTESDNESLGIMRKFFDFMEFSMLSDLILLNILIGNVTIFFADFSFFLLYPTYLYSLGLDMSEVAIYLTAVSALDLVGRIFLVIISKFFNFQSRYLCLFGTIISTIMRIAFLQFDVGLGLFVISMILGFFRGFIYCVSPVIIADYIPEKFTAAFALNMSFSGVFVLIVLPAIGYIRDYTGSYSITFYAIIFLGMPSILSWIFEIYYFKKKLSTK